MALTEAQATDYLRRHPRKAAKMRARAFERSARVDLAPDERRRASHDALVLDAVFAAAIVCTDCGAPLEDETSKTRRVGPKCFAKRQRKEREAARG